MSTTGAETTVAVTLVLGLVVFMIGAVRWKLAYERPFDEAAVIIDADRSRRQWVHVWMLVAMFLTPAGMAGLAMIPDAGPVAAMSAAVYALGASCFLVSLVFRMTVVPWAAADTVRTGAVPYGFAQLNAWAGWLYVVHMAASYAVFALLGVAVLQSSLLPAWVGWLGVGWGVTFLAGFVVTRFAGPFNPPFLAHTYPAVLGVLLLVT